MEQTLLSRIEISLERKIYQKSYYEFFKVAFAQLHPGQDYDDNWHIEYLCGVLQKEAERIMAKKPRDKDIIINMPFRSAKSMIATVIFPVWCWSQDPAMKFITGSYSSQLAEEHSRRSRDLINSLWFQRLYGTKVVIKKDAGGIQHYETTATGMRKAVGVTGQILGSGADIILLDDPISADQAASEKERENAINSYNNTIYSRLNQPDVGLRIIIMQRLHELDTAGVLLDEHKGRPDDHLHICIPGELDGDIKLNPPELRKHYVDNLFWHTRFSRKTLNQYKKSLGSLQYAGQIQQSPVPPEGNLFKRKWFEIIDPELISRNEHESTIHFFLDTAYTDKEDENDPSGILAGFKKGNDFYIINYVEVYMNFTNLCKFIAQYCLLNGYTNSSGIYIEPKANGLPVVERLREATSLNVIDIKVEGRMPDKMQKAVSVSPVAEAGKVKLVRGAWNDYFLSSLCSFPKAQHDEVVDCLYYSIEQMIPINDFLAAFM